MVKVLGPPVQLTPPKVNVGVTMIVAVWGEVPWLRVVKDSMSPLPDAARPMEVLLLDHAYEVVPPLLVVPKVTPVVLLPLQSAEQH